MKSIVLVHGFNVDDGGEGTIDTLKTFINIYHNLEILEADYGHLGFLGVRFFNDNIASLVAGMTPEGSIGIGHSNGCAILIRAARENPRAFQHLILINPALDSDFDVPEGLETVHVIYTEKDKAVWASKFRPFHEWGDAGKVGYTGKDNRVTNYNATALMGAEKHSDVFKNVYVFFDNILHSILKRLTKA